MSTVRTAGGRARTTAHLVVLLLLVAACATKRLSTSPTTQAANAKQTRTWRSPTRHQPLDWRTRVSGAASKDPLRTTVGTIVCGAELCKGGSQVCQFDGAGRGWFCADARADPRQVDATLECDDRADCEGGLRCCEVRGDRDCGDGEQCGDQHRVQCSPLDECAHEVCRDGGPPCMYFDGTQRRTQRCWSSARCGAIFVGRATCGDARCPPATPVCRVAGGEHTCVVEGVDPGIGTSEDVAVRYHYCTTALDCPAGTSCCWGLGHASQSACASDCGQLQAELVCQGDGECAALERRNRADMSSPANASDVPKTTHLRCRVPDGTADSVVPLRVCEWDGPTFVEPPPPPPDDSDSDRVYPRDPGDESAPVAPAN